MHQSSRWCALLCTMPPLPFFLFLVGGGGATWFPVGGGSAPIATDTTSCQTPPKDLGEQGGLEKKNRTGYVMSGRNHQLLILTVVGRILERRWASRCERKRLSVCRTLGGGGRECVGQGRRKRRGHSSGISPTRASLQRAPRGLQRRKMTCIGEAATWQPERTRKGREADEPNLR